MQPIARLDADARSIVQHCQHQCPLLSYESEPCAGGCSAIETAHSKSYPTQVQSRRYRTTLLTKRLLWKKCQRTGRQLDLHRQTKTRFSSTAPSSALSAVGGQGALSRQGPPPIAGGVRVRGGVTNYNRLGTSTCPLIFDSSIPRWHRPIRGKEVFVHDFCAARLRPAKTLASWSGLTESHSPAQRRKRLFLGATALRDVQ